MRTDNGSESCLHKVPDGTEFSSKAHAQYHEATCEAVARVAALLQCALKTGRVDAVVREMVDEEENIRKILNEFHKRKPKSLRSLPPVAG